MQTKYYRSASLAEFYFDELVIFFIECRIKFVDRKSLEFSTGKIPPSELLGKINPKPFDVKCKIPRIICSKMVENAKSSNGILYTTFPIRIRGFHPNCVKPTYIVCMYYIILMLGHCRVSTLDPIRMRDIRPGEFQVKGCNFPTMGLRHWNWANRWCNTSRKNDENLETNEIASMWRHTFFIVWINENCAHFLVDLKFCV